MSVLSFFAKRFVAGETADEAVEAARVVNGRGMGAILDFLGEDVRSASDARAASAVYEELIQKISAASADADVSLKASQMGILIAPELCAENVVRVAAAASKAKRFVWIDMEGSALTERTVNLFDGLRTQYSNIGLCLQAYLTRTGGDIDRLIRRPVSVRLCKGAYREPREVALQDRRAVDANFRVLSQKLLQAITSGAYPAFATHDMALIDFLKKEIRQRNIPSSQFEFQMLYGIQNRSLESLVKEEFRGRVYIPFGTAWLPYFMRRLRERKENLFFLLRNTFRR